MAVQLAAFLEAEYGGRGILLSEPGVLPAEVVILGCGVTGYTQQKLQRVRVHM